MAPHTTTVLRPNAHAHPTAGPPFSRQANRRPRCVCVVVGAGSALVGAGGSGGGARRARARGQGPSSWHRTCIRAPLPPGALLPGPPLRSQPGWPLPALPCAAAACWGSVALGRCCQFPCPSPLRFPCYQLHPARTGASRERAARAGACEQPSPSHRSHRHADRAATPQPRSGNSPRYPPGRLQVPRQLHDGIWSPVRRASGALPSIPPPLRSRSRCPSAPPPRPPVVVVSPQYQFHCGAERHRCRARAASHDCTRDLVRDAAQRAARRSRPGRTRAACSRSSRAHARRVLTLVTPLSQASHPSSRGSSPFWAATPTRAATWQAAPRRRAA